MLDINESEKGAISDLLCQTHSPGSSDHYFLLQNCFVVGIDGRTTGVKIVITSDRVDQYL